MEKPSQIETPNADRQELGREPKAFNPIEQKIEWCIALINEEYQNKFWENFPESLKSLFINAISNKSQKERDLILDIVLETIGDTDDVNNDLEFYLSDIVKTQTKQEREKNTQSLIDFLLTLDWKWKIYSHIQEKVIFLHANLSSNIIGIEAVRQEIASILHELENPQILLAVSQDLQEQDRRNGTNTYEAFRSAVVGLEPSFRARFALQEQRAMLTLGSDNLSRVSIRENGLKQDTGDGFTIEAAEGWKRNLKRLGGNLELRLMIEWDKSREAADKVEAELAAELVPLSKRAALIGTMLSFLKSADSLEQTKEYIKQLYPDMYNELGLTNAKSIDDMRFTLGTHQEQIQKNMDDIEARAKVYMQELAKDYALRLRDKKEIQKEVLKFLGQIWFDRLWQDVINIIVENINSNPSLKNKHWLNANIDFENGLIGFDKDFWNMKVSYKEKEAFISLFNSMLTGNKNYPVKINWSWSIEFYASEQDAQDNKMANALFDIWEFVNRRLGASPVFAIMDNLNKKDEI